MNLPSKSSSRSGRQPANQRGSTASVGDRAPPPHRDSRSGHRESVSFQSSTTKKPTSSKNETAQKRRSVSEILNNARNRDVQTVIELEEEEVTQDAAASTPDGDIPEENHFVSSEDVDFDPSRERRLRHLRAKDQESRVSRFDLGRKQNSSGSQQLSLKSKQKQLKKSVKPVTLDVYIPSVVSVGNLAKLLKVRLGTCFPFIPLISTILTKYTPRKLTA